MDGRGRDRKDVRGEGEEKLEWPGPWREAWSIIFRQWGGDANWERTHRGSRRVHVFVRCGHVVIFEFAVFEV